MKFENRVQRSRHLLTKMDKKIIEFIRTNELDDRFSTINSLALLLDLVISWNIIISKI